MESRKKGGHTSQLRRRAHPEQYPQCNLPKNYSFPEKSAQLAELVGIILGDGGITNDQVRVTLNKETEIEYIDFVANLLKKLFSVEAKRYQYSNPKVKVCNLAFSGVALVAYLAEIGIYKGNKVARQASVPKWVAQDKDYSLACLRGLIDTDGGVYYHRHSSGGYNYFNLGLTFTNASLPLVDFVHETLISLGFTSKKKPRGVFLYRQDEVVKYMQIVKSNNLHHVKRLKEFFSRKKTGRVA